MGYDNYRWRAGSMDVIEIIFGGIAFIVVVGLIYLFWKAVKKGLGKLK